MVETQQAPRMVNEITTCATDVLTDHVYHNRPQARRRRAIWSMMGRLLRNNWNGHLSRLLNLRWRLPIIDDDEIEHKLCTLVWLR